MAFVNHHYLPQVYLRRFTPQDNRRLLYEYDRTTGQVRESSPKKSGCEEHYHTLECEDGSSDKESVERFFGALENKVDQLYEAIRNRRALNTAEWETFYTFAGMMLVRVPKFVDRLDAYASEVLNGGFELLKAPLAGTWSKSELDSLEARAHPNFALLTALEMVPEFSELFSRMHWRFLLVEKTGYFVTCDAPIHHYSPAALPGGLYPPGLGDRHIIVLFPLARNVCAMGSWSSVSDLYVNVPIKEASTVNRRLVFGAHRFVYASRNDPALLGLLQSLRRCS